ncbi:tyrosine-type recombinase/integrase [Ascidiaceihabitans sp.]|nr:tyrosine-type recombinase/integrase [Ascidiaceihabitans sp.]
MTDIKYFKALKYFQSLLIHAVSPMPSILQLTNKFVQHLNIIFDTFNICGINAAWVRVQKNASYSHHTCSNRASASARQRAACRRASRAIGSGVAPGLSRMVQYELLSRRSELVALRTEDIEFRPEGTLRVLIRRSKYDPFGEGPLAFTSERTAGLVIAWLERRGPHIQFLFFPIYHQKEINRGLSTSSVKSMINSTAQRDGLNPSIADEFSGHSLRDGAAQDLLRKHFDKDAIMRAGGWKFVTTLSRYLEKAAHNVWA